MSPTKADLEQQVKDAGKAVPAGANKEDLERIAAQGDLSKSADVAVDGHHPQSVIEDVSDEEKAASASASPDSVLQREIRPDERDLEPGTSALQAPPAE